MSFAIKHRQLWLHSASFDLPFILFPALMALGVTLLLPSEYKLTDSTSVIGWVVLVLLIDVAHVYSTLFRTYWDKNRFAKHKTLYTIIPLACYVAGVILYSMGALLFWRILAYLAVYHFVRQQYGFVRLYSRGEDKTVMSTKIDAITIYAATLYPLIYWHCTPDRNFNWFVRGDFVIGDLAIVRQIAGYVYGLILATYTVKELVNSVKHRRINIPKNVMIAGTALSWYFGIVYFNGDMAFTLLNVVAHGIPYMALIWLFRQRETGESLSVIIRKRSPQYTLAFFILVVVVFAYLEEGLWDGLVWREHGQVFGLFQSLPVLRSKEALALLVPLLSLPQSTHYVLDGFIWRKGHG